MIDPENPGQFRWWGREFKTVVFKIARSSCTIYDAGNKEACTRIMFCHENIPHSGWEYKDWKLTFRLKPGLNFLIVTVSALYWRSFLLFTKRPSSYLSSLLACTVFSKTILSVNSVTEILFQRVINHRPSCMCLRQRWDGLSTGKAREGILSGSWCIACVGCTWARRNWWAASTRNPHCSNKTTSTNFSSTPTGESLQNNLNHPQF